MVPVSVETIELRLSGSRMPIYLGHGLRPEEFAETCLAESPPDCIGIVSDANVFPLYGCELEQLLVRRGFPVTTVQLPPGEQTKCLAIAGELYGQMHENGFSRRSLLIALGGGVVGDLAGFVAGTYMRGIDCIQVPTSLLAQVDSAIGGKTAVNSACAKNLIGLFHHPRAVWVDTACLATLPAPEFNNAFGEIIKYALVLAPDLLDLLRAQASLEFVRQDDGALRALVRRCLRCKAEVVAQDEREQGFRRVLNFGHTFGHALEATAGLGRLRHGEAVGWGMILAQELGRNLGRVNPEWAADSTALIRKLLRLPPLAGIDPETVLAHLQRDKKNSAGRRLVVLSPAPGRHCFEENVDSGAIRAVLETHMGGHE